MEIDWAGFTPIASFVGGCMIGLAAAMLMAINGRVMGVSGVLGGLVTSAGSGNKHAEDDKSWRWLFVAGTVIGPFVVWGLQGAPIEITPVASAWMVPVAGFFVGIGAAVGNGCTSGHGICGLARLSVRSFVAVGTFVSTGIITVYILRHVL